MVSKITFARLQCTTSRLHLIMSEFWKMWKILPSVSPKYWRNISLFSSICCTSVAQNQISILDLFRQLRARPSSPLLFFFLRFTSPAFSLSLLLSLWLRPSPPAQSAPPLHPRLPPSLCICPLTFPLFLPETSLSIDCLSLTWLHSFFFFFCFVSPSPFLKVAKICF